jgi:hypothetical protein
MRLAGISEKQIRVIVRRECMYKRMTLAQMHKWAHDIADLTRGRSGFFSIPFIELLPVLDKMLEEE